MDFFNTFTRVSATRRCADLGLGILRRTALPISFKDLLCYDFVGLLTQLRKFLNWTTKLFAISEYSVIKYCKTILPPMSNYYKTIPSWILMLYSLKPYRYPMKIAFILIKNNSRTPYVSSNDWLISIHPYYIHCRGSINFVNVCNKCKYVFEIQSYTIRIFEINTNRAIAWATCFCLPLYLLKSWFTHSTISAVIYSYGWQSILSQISPILIFIIYWTFVRLIQNWRWI